jgi:hypothetical protein
VPPPTTTLRSDGPHPREEALIEGSPALEVVESPLDAEDAIRASQPLPDALPVLPLR